MLHLHTQRLLCSHFFLPSSHLHSPSSISPSLSFLCRPIVTHHSVSAHLRTRHDRSWLAQVEEPEPISTTAATTPEEEGPIELSPSTPSIFATSDDPSPLQVATSLLFTGAISVLLFRSFSRRALRSKERRLASEAKKTLKDEAIESLKAMTPTPAKSKGPPSPANALLGALTAGVIALILYKFTTTIEAALNRQTLSDNYSVRQLTVTIRTIVNGMCYLATFVFGFNSLGLFLYSGQLAINSLMGSSTSKETESRDEMQVGTSNLTGNSPTNSSEIDTKNKDQTSDKTQ